MASDDLPEDKHLIRNDWSVLREFTPARIGLGRAGTSLPTRVNLQFQLDHARARDAVLAPLDVPGLQMQLGAIGLASQAVKSMAHDRHTYLQRPDLGRTLQSTDARLLREQWHGKAPWDIAILVADGLSSLAVERHAVPLLQRLLPLLQPQYRVAPVCVAEQGRVSLGDDVGEALQAKLVLVLIGERPGLSSPDSLGIYLTWQPRRGRTDADRNCISNVRPEGLDYAAAAQTCAYLVAGAFKAGLSGVQLKDQSRVLENTALNAIPFLANHSLPTIIPE
ncbi:MAG: ethanolamine ammonia-lyase subunit EutC [Gammaproteobacteria bacterium]|nr:ethanolamine ammonia-lyase subunit EutC [Gammaproteobacteria bacterium]